MFHFCLVLMLARAGGPRAEILPSCMMFPFYLNSFRDMWLLSLVVGQDDLGHFFFYQQRSCEDFIQHLADSVQYSKAGSFDTLFGLLGISFDILVVNFRTF